MNAGNAGLSDDYVRRSSSSAVVNFKVAAKSKASGVSNDGGKSESAGWSTMRLKILLPYRVFADESGVTHILVVTKSGAFGLLPHRLDCTTAIVPGILAYRNKSGEDAFLAVDEGSLIKTGSEVIISVRNAIGGQDLGKLRAAVEHEFLDLDERERSLRNLIVKVESDFVRRFLEMQRG